MISDIMRNSRQQIRHIGAENADLLDLAARGHIRAHL
jgi:hypothetical protein